VSRTLIIVAIVVVVVVAAVTVWIAIRPTDDAGQASTPAPAPQKFDTTSGQEMKPRWNVPEGEGQGNGGADGAADN
jgi:flagellar basal body-associated protein FliL